MTGTTSLVKGSITGYNETEKQFIHNEFKSLMAARQEKYKDDTLREWVKAFWDNGYNANQVCRRIRAVKEALIYGKVTFADFVNAEIEEVPDIISNEVKDEYLYLTLICRDCGKSTTMQKKDLYVFKKVRICEHQELNAFDLKHLYGQVNSNYQEIEV